VEKSFQGLSLGGPLDGVQEVAGVKVEGALDVAYAGKTVTLARATVAEPTPLPRFGLPPGELPAHGGLVLMPGKTLVVSEKPVTVCGVALNPLESYPGVRQITFERDLNSHQMNVQAAFAEPAQQPGDGPVVSGNGGLHLPREGCEGMGLYGT